MPQRIRSLVQIAGWSFFSLYVAGCSTVISSPNRHPSNETAEVPPPPAAGTDPAIELMKRQTEIVDRLYATSSFANAQDLAAAIDKSDADSRRALHILDNGDVQVVLAQPEKIRDLIVQAGFRNVHETNTSGGVMDPDLRDGAEGAYLEMSPEEFKRLPNEIKPKYGYLAPKQNSLSAGLASPRGVWNYGEDRWTFKMSDIRQRMSLTAGDSLNGIIPYLDYETHSITDRKDDANVWNLRFIPWSRRHILAPILAQGIGKPKKFQGELTFGNTLGVRLKYFKSSERAAEKNHLFSGMGTDTCTTQAMANSHENRDVVIPYSVCTMFDNRAPGFEKYCAGCAWSMDYIEAQIWGPLTLDDVESLTYTKTPPSSELLAALTARGITVIDGREKHKSPATAKTSVKKAVRVHRAAKKGH